MCQVFKRYLAQLVKALNMYRRGRRVAMPAWMAVKLFPRVRFEYKIIFNLRRYFCHTIDAAGAFTGTGCTRRPFIPTFKTLIY